MAATDDIKVKGAVFPILPPHQAHKQALGVHCVRMPMIGDFSEEKAQVLGEMNQRLSALPLDPVLSPILKDLEIAIRGDSCVQIQCWLGPLVQDRTGADLQVMADCLQASVGFFVQSGQLAKGGASAHQQ
jgi:hypothetical protein